MAIPSWRVAGPVSLSAFKDSGPLKVGNSLVDAFTLQYYEGFPMDQVAWVKPLPLAADGSHAFPDDIPPETA